MGQYYFPAIIENFEPEMDKPEIKAWLSSHNYGNGLKLMEHSYLGNKFMNAVERLLLPDGYWHGLHLVWAGDYEDYKFNNRTANTFNLCNSNEANKITPISKPISKLYRYIINYSKKEFVDKKKVPVSDTTTYKDEKTGREKKEIWQLHPLSLLTAAGNGKGGGDFWGEDKQGLVGRWAYDKIGIVTKVPEGFTEINFDLIVN